jgi:hypothetical protein
MSVKEAKKISIGTAVGRISAVAEEFKVNPKTVTLARDWVWGRNESGLSQLEGQAFREARRLSGLSISRLRLLMAPYFPAIEMTSNELKKRSHPERGTQNSRREKRIWTEKKLREDYGFRQFGESWHRSEEEVSKFRKVSAETLGPLIGKDKTEWGIFDDETSDEPFDKNSSMLNDDEILLLSHYAGETETNSSSGKKESGFEGLKPILAVHRVTVRCLLKPGTNKRKDQPSNSPQLKEVDVLCFFERVTGLIKLVKLKHRSPGREEKRTDDLFEEIRQAIAAFTAKLSGLGFPPGTIRFVTVDVNDQIVATASGEEFTSVLGIVPRVGINGYAPTADLPCNILSFPLYFAGTPVALRAHLVRIANLHNRGAGGRKTYPLIMAHRWLGEIRGAKGQAELSYSVLREKLKIG